MFYDGVGPPGGGGGVEENYELDGRGHQRGISTFKLQSNVGSPADDEVLLGQQETNSVGNTVSGYLHGSFDRPPGSNSGSSIIQCVAGARDSVRPTLVACITDGVGFEGCTNMAPSFVPTADEDNRAVAGSLPPNSDRQDSTDGTTGPGSPPPSQELPSVAHPPAASRNSVGEPIPAWRGHLFEPISEENRDPVEVEDLWSPQSTQEEEEAVGFWMVFRVPFAGSFLSPNHRTRSFSLNDLPRTDERISGSIDVSTNFVQWINEAQVRQRNFSDPSSETASRKRFEAKLSLNIPCRPSTSVENESPAAKHQRNDEDSEDI